MSVLICVITTVPTIQHSKLPILIGHSPEFLSSEISRQARKVSKDIVWFSTLQIFLMTSSNALHSHVMS